jgi:hypothetical protein
MTRTHVDEAELVDLQRKALKVFQWVDQISWRRPVRLSSSELDLLDATAKLAREVSVLVDDLTEYVRYSRCIDEGR